MILFIGIALTSFSVSVNAANCDPIPASSVDRQDFSLAIPNCLTGRAVSQATGSRRNTNLICRCKPEFERKAIISPIPGLTKEQRQAMFFETMFQEFEKVLKSNLVDIAKMSALDLSGQLNLTNSLRACSYKSASSFTSGCASKAAVAFFSDPNLIQNYDKKISQEILNLMGPLQTVPAQGLLNRTGIYSTHSPAQCSLSEYEAMKFTNQALEKIIAPDFLQALASKRDELTNLSINEIFDKIGFNSSLYGMLRNHPLISLHIKSPSQFLRFIDSIPSPKNTSALQTTLFSTDNSKLVDLKLAQNCGESFTKLKEAVCSEKFESGEIDLDPFGNLTRLGMRIPGDLTLIASTEEEIDLNKRILQFCPWQGNTNSVNLSSSLAPLSEMVDATYQSMSDEEFSIQKFNLEIGTARDQICASINQTCTPDMDLVARHSCLAAQLWRDSQKNPAPVSPRLAQRPISELIRGFLPPAESMDARTKNELIRIGIIPTPQAQRPTPAQVAQAAAEVERFNPNFTSAANATLPRSRSQGPASAVVQADTTQNETRVSAPAPQRSAYSAQLAEVMSQKQRMFEESNQTYRGVIDELMKRRMDNPSQQEVTEAVTEEFRQAGKPFDPRSREGQSFINNIVNNYPRAVAQNNPQAITRPFEQERVAQAFEEAVTIANSSPGPTAGRTIAGSDINSIAASASLTSSPAANGVAKVVVTDPKLNLADPALPQLLQSVLTLNENGEVLQSMLDQRKDFILKLNSTEVMMDFDPEAQTYRIRPLGTVPTEVIASLNRFVNDYSLIARVRGSRHTTLNALVQELQQSQSSL